MDERIPDDFDCRDDTTKESTSKKDSAVERRNTNSVIETTSVHCCTARANENPALFEI